jgi:hypothetical protein
MVGGAIPLSWLGQTCKEPRLCIAGANGEWMVWGALKDLKEARRKPMRW